MNQEETICPRDPQGPMGPMGIRGHIGPQGIQGEPDAGGQHCKCLFSNYKITIKKQLQ